MDSLRPTVLSGPKVTINCAVSAHGWLSVPAADVGTLRARVTAAYPDTLSVGVLKQTDEQSLVALLALRRATLAGVDLSSWGLVAAPRMLGRRRIADGLNKFRQQGAWSTSPHLIPHLSLHSLPGILSQALRLHGPNIGAGGMRGSEGEALWAALALLHGERLPGVLVVFTGWDRETLAADGTCCQAAVLALQVAATDACPKLTFVPGTATGEPFSLEALGAALEGSAAGAWNIGGAACRLSFHVARLEAAA